MSQSVLSIPVVVACAAGPIAVLSATFGPVVPAVRRAAGALSVGAVAALTVVAGTISGATGRLPGFEVGAGSALVLVLVCGMGAIVIGYAGRSLRHEPYQRRFAILGSSLVGVGSIVALTTNLIVLGLAWLATSGLTVALLRTGPSGGVLRRSERARRAFVAGDVAMVGAVAILVIGSGSTSSARIGSASAGALSAAGVLLVVAAASRSASGPFMRWLPDSLGAPTPSSALLHAGVVNGGALVLIKLSPAVAGTGPAATFAVALGGISCVVAEAVMLTRPDVKGRLAWSTIAQMSFTLLLCGLGLVAAATAHLVAHGLYKGALFLGSGGAVRSLVRHRAAPPMSPDAEHPKHVTTVAAFVLSAAAVLGVVAARDASVTPEMAVPLGLVWVTGGCGLAAALWRTAVARQRVGIATVGVGAVAGFVVFAITIERAIGSTLPSVRPVASEWWVVAVLAGLVTVALTRRTSLHGDSLPARLWALATALGRPTARQPLVVTRTVPDNRPRSIGGEGVLQPSLSGA